MTNSVLGVRNIQHTNGTDAITIASDGAITAGAITGNYLIDDNYPIFACTGISGFQSAAYEGVGANIVCPSGYTTTVINQAGLMGTDGAMVAPADGIYEFLAQSNGGTTTGHRGLYVYHKSSAGTNNIDNVFTMNDYSGYTISSHRILSLSQGDKVLWGYHNSYVAWSSATTQFHCFGRRLK